MASWPRDERHDLELIGKSETAAARPRIKHQSSLSPFFYTATPGLLRASAKDAGADFVGWAQGDYALKFFQAAIGIASVTFAAPAFASAPLPQHYAEVSSHASGLPNVTPQDQDTYKTYNYDYAATVVDPQPYLTVYSALGSHAGSAIGELHVSASVLNEPGVQTLPLYNDAVKHYANNNFSTTGQASWQDLFTINSNQVMNGTYTATITVDGQNSDIGVKIPNGGAFGAVTASVHFDFMTVDATGTVFTPIASFSEFESTYGGTPYISVSTDRNATSLFGTFNLDVPFVTGQQTYLRASASCAAQANSIAIGAEVDNVCDLSHSVYWGGISHVVDSQGAAVTDVTTQSQSGFNFQNASPSSPGAVPEPAAWALMLSGMALSGGALRRRREMASFPG